MSANKSDLFNNKAEPNFGAGGWVELQDKRDFSRLLFPSPVCFLSVIHNVPPEAYSDAGKDDMLVTRPTSPKYNVMILSWLTALTGTNNTENGRFVFSLNKRRHTASILDNNVEYCLSIPVQGMEELVCNVGSTSGRWGSSKFPASHTTTNKPEQSSPHEPERPKSKRARKKELLSCGIPGLATTPLGQSNINDAKMEKDQKEIDVSNVFAVNGTVAHLKCKLIRKKEETLIDDGHYFVFAEITRAFVLQTYWDEAKHVFAPELDAKPILSFFGSQTFGYIVPKIPVIAEVPTKQKSNSQWIKLTERKQFSRLLYTNPLCLLCQGNQFTSGNAWRVLSHLTANNNEGSFMCSIERNCTEEKWVLSEDSIFTLSVPSQSLQSFVQGLQESEKHAEPPKIVSVAAVPIKECSESRDFVSIQDDIVEGTVAKLNCTVQHIFDECDLLFAKVENAVVHPSYWDSKKDLFRPASDGCLPYMKYLGNQSYAYVLAH